MEIVFAVGFVLLGVALGFGLACVWPFLLVADGIVTREELNEARNQLGSRKAGP